MSELRIIVDHQKLDYTGLFNAKQLFSLMGEWFKEKGFDKKEDKNFEQNLPQGKFIEYEISYWKKISHSVRYIFKIRALFSEIKKVEAVKDKDKIEADEGRVSMFFDGFIEHDYENRWDDRPLLIFFRTLYEKFIYKAYTERFEQRLTKDTHDLYNVIKSFLNMHRYYRVVSRIPHFAH